MLRRAFPLELILLGLCLLAAGVSLAAEEPAEENPVYTDPAAAGEEYAIQGEYSGEIPRDEGAFTLGVQVIALGGGKFRAVAYVGGLPGDGWNGEDRNQVEGELVGDTVRFVGEHATGELRNGKIVVTSNDGRKLTDLERIDRESPTLGMSPPEGAVVLFDGTTAEEFDGGHLTEDGLLMQGVTSKRTFQSCTVHLEFRTPFQPTATGQARGNSGCYLQGRYEVQMLDSFGLEGTDHDCGGIYSIAGPKVNMCFPPLAWQTYDIDYTAATFDDAGQKTDNARMTVRHNGVAIHDNVELTHATTAAPVGEGPTPGPLYLQDHGNPVRYRNIWVVEK